MQIVIRCLFVDLSSVDRSQYKIVTRFGQVTYLKQAIGIDKNLFLESNRHLFVNHKDINTLPVYKSLSYYKQLLNYNFLIRQCIKPPITATSIIVVNMFFFQRSREVSNARRASETRQKSPLPHNLLLQEKHKRKKSFTTLKRSRRRR